MCPQQPNSKDKHQFATFKAHWTRQSFRREDDCCYVILMEVTCPEKGRYILSDLKILIYSTAFALKHYQPGSARSRGSKFICIQKI